MKYRESSIGVSGFEHLSVIYRRFYGIYRHSPEIYRKNGNPPAMKISDNCRIFLPNRPILVAGKRFIFINIAEGYDAF